MATVKPIYRQIIELTSPFRAQLVRRRRAVFFQLLRVIVSFLRVFSCANQNKSTSNFEVYTMVAVSYTKILYIDLILAKMRLYLLLYVLCA